jgi:hypothetical protein
MADTLNTKSPTALNRDAKAAIQLAFEDLGGIPRLVAWANANNGANIGQFFTQIWSKIIPKDVKAEIDGNLIIEVVRFGEDLKKAAETKKMLDDGHVIETTAVAIIEKATEDDGPED